MTEEKKEDLYKTLLKISKGDVELFKDETKNFITVVGQHTGAAARMKRSDTPIKKTERTHIPAVTR